jgi:16S rRNA G966 N2-methylase RsmD
MYFDYKTDLRSLDDIKYIKNGYLHILPNEWGMLRETFSKEQIKDHIANFIKTLPYPYSEYTEQGVKRDFLDLKEKQPSFVFEEWIAPRQTSELDCKYLRKSVYLDCYYRGKTVSNYFTQDQRIRCGYRTIGNSPYDGWTNPDKKNSFLRCLFGITEPDIYKRGGVNKQTLRRAINMHTYMPSQFKAESAKDLYNLFQAKKILDFSAGWGDRLVGFLASGAQSYIGIDPNTKLHEPYQKIVDFCEVGKETRFICSPAEDTELSGVKVDFVFTSPPYFDIERCSQENTQSWKRYPKMGQWLQRFLFATLTKCWSILEDGGRIAINIADKKGEDICSPMLKHMENLGATYEGVIGYRMSERGGQKATVSSCEPIFIWSKGSNPPAPKWNQDNFFGV